MFTEADQDEADLPPRLRFLAGGGDATRRILARDWTGHPLGPPEGWPEALKVSLSTVLNSPESMILAWDRHDLTFFFNETYFPLLGPRLDWAMGAPFTQVWADAWDQARPIIDDAFAGRSQRYIDLPWKLATDRGLEDTWWTFSYSRILDANGDVAGLLIVTSETTDRVLTDQRSAIAERQLLQAQEGGGIGLFSVDADGTVSPSATFCRIFGVEPADKLPSTVFEGLVLPEYCEITANARSRAKGEIPLEVEYRIRRADTGAIRWIARKGEVERADDGTFVRLAGVVRDITDQVDAREALARQQFAHAVLFTLGERLNDAASTDDVADAATAVLGQALGASMVGYGIVDADGEVVWIERDWTDGARSFAGSVCFRDYGSFIDDLKAGQAVVIADVRDDPRVAGNIEDLIAQGVRAFVTIPIVEQGEFRAILYVGMAQAFAWTDETVALIREVATRMRTASERARSQEDLRQSEEQFRVFAQAVPNQVWAATPAGALYWVNDQVAIYMGVAPDDLLGPEAWVNGLYPDDVPHAAAAWTSALADGRPYEVEFRIRRHDGGYRWFLVRAQPVRGSDGAIVRWVGTNTDIDDAKRQAEALEEQVAERTTDRNRLWQMSSDIMLVADLTGRIEAVNPAWTRILGWTEDELLGRPLLDLIHPDDLQHTLAAATAIAEGAKLTRFGNRYRHKDGSYRDITWATGPGDGKIIGVGRDETMEKAQAAQLAAAEDQLRQAQKMEAVGQLTGGIAHDFNNMLTGVIGSMDLLKRHLGPDYDARTARYIDAATTSAHRAAGLTQRLLAFSRRQSLDIRPVNVNALVIGLEDLLRRTLGENIQLEIALLADTWPISTDANQLESALLNLAINARDAMPHGGSLLIETVNLRYDTDAIMPTDDLAPGEYVTIAVSDSGAGMPPSVIGKAFDPFFTTKPIGAGTGLGLSMIWGFAKQSGGHVWIESQVGFGTTVRLYLPRHYGTADMPEAANAARRPARDGECVLLVEDEPAVRMLIADLLSDLGYQVEQAQDARAALPLIRSMPRIDLLVTDVGLPGMNGRELANAAREHRPDLKVLFVTGYAEGATLRSDFLDTDMDMISKPFEIEALSIKIRDMLEQDSTPPGAAITGLPGPSGAGTA